MDFTQLYVYKDPALLADGTRDFADYVIHLASLSGGPEFVGEVRERAVFYLRSIALLYQTTGSELDLWEGVTSCCGEVTSLAARTEYRELLLQYVNGEKQLPREDYPV